LSHVETRQVTNDYTIRYNGKIYQIERKDICTGLRRASVRVESRLDGSLAVCFRKRYLAIKLCEAAPRRSKSNLLWSLEKDPLPRGTTG
jgi:hypothetical protein